MGDMFGRYVVNRRREEIEDKRLAIDVGVRESIATLKIECGVVCMVVGNLSGDRPDDAGYLCLAYGATVSLAVIVLGFEAFDISTYNHQTRVKATT